VYAAEYPGHVSPFENAYFRRSIVATLRHAELILTNSEFTAREVRRIAGIYHLQAPRVVCVGIGFERPPALNLPRENHVVALTSNWPHKRTHLALGWLERWQRESQFQGTIHLIGSLPKNTPPPAQKGWVHRERLAEPDYRRLLQQARTLVYFSDYEGFGMPPVEATLANVSAVYSDLPPTRESMGGAGLPFSNMDFESFRRAMDRAMSLSPELSHAWAEQLLARHNWGQVAQRVVSALEEASA
jgi:glycosyltransferase involved in cell wall biosynthesis